MADRVTTVRICMAVYTSQYCYSIDELVGAAALVTTTRPYQPLAYATPIDITSDDHNCQSAVTIANANFVRFTYW